MEHGVYTAGFYDLTPVEIYDIIVSAGKRREDELRRAAVMAWNTAYLNGLAVNSPRRFPRSPEQHFEFLKSKETDWRRCRDNMAKIAAVHNKGKGTRNDR